MDLIYRFDPFQAVRARRIERPEEAVRALEDGNRQYRQIVDRLRDRFLGGDAPDPLVLPLDPMTFGVSMVDGASVAQAPFALVLGCSDARVPVELIFHQTCNDLFVVRVAGNVLGIECLGSIDYAVRKMESLKLAVVLGHTGCGAVTSAVDMYLEPTDYPDLGLTHALRSLVDRVMMAVRGAANALERVAGPKVSHDRGYRAALIEMAVFLNAALTAYDVRRELDAVGRGPGIGVVYGVFDLGTQHVRSRPEATAEAGPPFATAPVQVADFDELAVELARSVVGRGAIDPAFCVRS